MLITRQYALQVLNKYTKTPSLVKHGLAVEAVMQHFARKFNHDELYWGVVGLLHDVDYELYPQEHLKKAPQMLQEAGYDEQFIHAVLSHGYGLCTDIEPELFMEKVLYTIDELTGLITAAVYMRPSKSIDGLEVSSLKKKFKTKSFASGVNREVINNGCALLELPIEEVMQLCIDGMKEKAEILGV